MKPWLDIRRLIANARQKKLETALRAIIDPRAQTDVVASGFVSHFAIQRRDLGYRAVITLELPGGPSAQNEALAEQVAIAARLPGIDDVQLIKSAHRARASGARNDLQPEPHDGSSAGIEPQHRSATGGQQRPPTKRPNPSRKLAPSRKIALPDVTHIITITSGKGGVGKSTIAANIALALAQTGHRVGLMDADIYGPSVPVLFGLTERANVIEGRLQPIKKFGLKLMSIGLLLDEAQALAWRGPMVMGAIRKLLEGVDWGRLDYLIIDTPPGTGDAHLTLLQSLTVSGAVIVTTPQKMALTDVRRGIALLRKMSVPVLGLIENMAWLETESGQRLPVYGPSRGPQIAAIEDVPFLKALPIMPALAEACDQGVPLAAAALLAPDQKTLPPGITASTGQMIANFNQIAQIIPEKLVEAGQGDRL